MSKIGRKPIDVSKLPVTVKGKDIKYKGAKSTGVYHLPAELDAEVRDGLLYIQPTKEAALSRGINRIWGLHRALLANEIAGAAKDFELCIEIKGLGFKAAKSGKDLLFTLGFSHKIDFPMPEGVVVDIDKTGQQLTLKSPDKELLGLVCSRIRSLRQPEPYKGTGIKVGGEEIARKAGKAKAA